MCSRKWWNVSFFLLFSPNNSKFCMYAWGKKGKMLVFTGVYVCVKANLTLVSFFSCFFFAPFPNQNYHQSSWISFPPWSTVLKLDLGVQCAEISARDARFQASHAVQIERSHVGLVRWQQRAGLIQPSTRLPSSSCIFSTFSSLPGQDRDNPVPETNWRRLLLVIITSNLEETR